MVMREILRGKRISQVRVPSVQTPQPIKNVKILLYHYNLQHLLLQYKPSGCIREQSTLMTLLSDGVSTSRCKKKIYQTTGVTQILCMNHSPPSKRSLLKQSTTSSPLQNQTTSWRSTRQVSTQQVLFLFQSYWVSSIEHSIWTYYC